MKTHRIELFILLSLCFATVVRAQGFNCALENWDYALYDVCGGTTELPDGIVVEIVHDVDQDGFDWEDPLATLCTAPPECLTGPQGTVNFNSFPLNGIEWGQPGGTWFNFYNFISAQDRPTVNRFYLRICVETGPSPIYYYSRVFSPASGASTESFNTPSDWTCVSGHCYFPGQVAGVEASDSSGIYCWGIHVTWDAMSAIDSFVIKRDGIRIGMSLGNTNTYDDSLAERGVPYSYTVTAHNQIGVGDESEADWGSRKALPGQVVDLVATDDHCLDVYLQWSNTTREDSFRVFRDGEFLAVTMANDTDFSDTTAPIDVYSVYQVVSANACGAGDTSNTANGYRYMYPTVVSGIAASSGQCIGIDITWAPSIGHLSGYIIYRNDIVIDTVESSTTNYLDATAPGGYSEYKIVAYSIYCGNSAPPEPVIGYRLVPPPIPTNISATDDFGEWCGSVTVTWDNVELETGYLLRRNGSFLGFLLADCTQFIDYPSAGRYAYSVQSFNECGASYTSVPDSGTAMTLASANLNAALGDNCESIILEWISTPNADSIRVFRDGEELLTVTAADSFYTDSAVPPGQHDYWIVAVNECGDASPNDTMTAEIIEYPGAPIGLMSTDNHCDAITLSWAPATGSFGTYRVYKDDIHTTTLPQSQTSWTDSAVIGNMEYVYRVTAMNDTCGESESSTPLLASITDMEPLMSPQIVIAMEGSNARINWNAITGTIDSCPVMVTGYLVFYSPLAEGPFYYHGFTTDTTYVHNRVIQFAEGMYYDVVAYAGALEPVMRIDEGVLREHAIERLHR